MNFTYYLTNGTSNSLPPTNEKFFILQFQKSDNTLGYEFPGDEIFYRLDTACVNLYDLFRDNLFNSPDEYYKYLDFQPQGLTRAGLDSDFDLSKEDFAKYFSNTLHSLYPPSTLFDPKFNTIISEIDTRKNHFAYLADCQSLINTLQELICSSRSSFIGFYKYLYEVPVQFDFEKIYYDISTEGRIVFNLASNLIISLYSCFDILTKICYELENLKDCSGNYPKLASSKKLFGDKKDLKKIDFNNTIFEKNTYINIISSLRNELVHNATWEMNPKIFIRVNENELIEKFIFMPDFDNDGYLLTYKNRKRFSVMVRN